jgi:Chaperone of endosialidase
MLPLEQWVLMSMQENMKVGPETITPEIVPAVQETCVRTSWATCNSTGRQTNIQATSGALGMIERLRGVSFDWISDGKHDIGLIAEAVALDKSRKDIYAVAYTRLVAILIEAMKEQQVQI